MSQSGSSLIEQIYLTSPIWLQQVMVAAYGWGWYRRRFGGPFQALLAELRSRDRWSVSEFHGYQERKLAELFAHAWRSPYYQATFPPGQGSLRTNPHWKRSPDYPF